VVIEGASDISCMKVDEMPALRTVAVLRHRLVTNFSAEAEGVSVDTIIRELTASV
jgi:hypothetical protein